MNFSALTVSGALAAIALATFRLPQAETAGSGIPHVVWILSLHSLPATVLLFSVSPLLHGWLEKIGLPGSVRLQVDVDPYSFL